MGCSTQGFPIHHQLPEPTQTHVHLVGDAIQPSHPLSTPSPPAFNLTQHQGLFKGVGASNEYSGLISFRIISLDLLAVQGTLKSLLQHDSSNASIPQSSAFFIVQLLHPYVTSGKTIALTRRTFVGKVMSLLFNMLPRLVIAFLPRRKCLFFFFLRKCLLISWLQSPTAVILEPKRIVCHCFHWFPIYLPWSDGTGCHDLSFLNAEF